MIGNAMDIWQVPAYLPYLQPSLTDELLAKAERKLGFTLPMEFVDLLREQNGGYIRYSLPDAPHRLIKGIGPNFPSLTDFDWAQDQDYVSFPLHGLVPFDGDGHWHICLDFRADARNPSVTYVDVECDSTSIVADSFSAYLSLLEIQCADECVIDSLPDISDFKSKLSLALHCEFSEPDSSAHGYPISRAKVGNPAASEWLWLSPNRVPRGFVRSNDARYDELKSLLPGHGLRFNELPAGSYLIRATDGIRDRVKSAIETLGWELRPLSDYLNRI